jgi:hypothetical protein
MGHKRSVDASNRAILFVLNGCLLVACVYADPRYQSKRPNPSSLFAIRHKIRTVTPKRLSLLNFPIGKLKVLHDLLGDGILLVVGECAS